MRRARSTLLTLRLAAMALPLAGCLVGPDFTSPKAPDVPRYTAGPQPASTTTSATTGGSSQALVVGADVPGAWWTAFRSPALDGMVRQALARNPSVTAAQATLRQAQETARAEQGALFPTISASLGAQRNRTSLASTGLNGSYTSSTLSGSLDMSYTLDVFGGTRRQIEQYVAQADYQRFELEATILSLTANTVTAAINEASLRGQVAATQDIIKTYSDGLGILERRLAAGGVAGADVLQQKASLAAAVATLPPLQKQAEQARHQLAVYVGMLPSQIDVPVLDLQGLTLPGTLPVSLPSELVRQRPDIRAYEALIHAASAELGVAIANTLPQITLTGSYGRQGSGLSNLFSPAGIVYSLAGSLAQPLFDGGTLRARKRAAQAALEAAAAAYSSTVNTAFQNVADSLVALARDAETLRAQTEALSVAEQSLRVARGQYAAGGTTYLNVLTAEQTYATARLNLVPAQAARFTDTVALFQSLGGGWWNRAPSEPRLDGPR